MGRARRPGRIALFGPPTRYFRYSTPLNRHPSPLNSVSGDCQGTSCHHIIRLDSDAFRDPQTGHWWLSYS